jgi:hypothetical protein
MPRLACTLLALVTACGATRSPAPITNARPATRYALQPIWLHGGMGHHSAFQTWTMLSGSLEVAGSRVTLQLAAQNDTSPIHCGGEYVGMQQCAPPDSKFESRTDTRAFTGDARWDAGTLRVDLTQDKVKLSLACNDTLAGYACAITSEQGFRNPIGDNPTRFVFAPLVTRRFELQPVRSGSGTEVTGTLMLRPDATAQVVLTTATKTVTREATLRWAPAGLVVSAGPALSSLTLSCDERAALLACHLTADRTVLGDADHLIGDVTLALRQ